MIERREFLAATGAMASLALGACATPGTEPRTSAAGSGVCTVFDKSRQASISPDAALARLKQGNARFASGKSTHCDLLTQVKATADGQAPFAAVVGCIDSRVPPELVFDQHIGDLFVARIAGNFINTDIIGSLEFATQLEGAKLIVVLGHSECGAIKGAVDDAKLGNLTATLANIRPAIIKILPVDGPQSSKNKKLVQAVADQNARDAVALLTARSEVLRDLVAQGKLKIIAAMHDLTTGRITWFS